MPLLTTIISVYLGLRPEQWRFSKSDIGQQNWCFETQARITSKECV
ncbi:unnamed protein product [Rhodiola kirilowii]